MRVITGAARGCRLDTLPGEDTRPTGERVKEALFSAIQFEIEGRRVLDLFGRSVSWASRHSAAARPPVCSLTATRQRCSLSWAICSVPACTPMRRWWVPRR